MGSHVNPDVSLGFALKRLQQGLRSRMDSALAEHGLTTPQYAVLALLAEHPGISNAELARRSFVAAPTMLRILDTLDHAGLIARAAPAPDQRTRGTVLTAGGRKRLTAATPDVQGFEDLLVTKAAPEHLDVILAWLRDCAAELTA
ncbi:MAG TPA: MarR family transcriptional regulator [Pseudonocardiaceae bacterium]|nr:MarR family transcriptional regulator [Pseudonocardiaceae bacterium]